MNLGEDVGEMPVSVIKFIPQLCGLALLAAVNLITIYTK
jgi:hypothetical protein